MLDRTIAPPVHTIANLTLPTCETAVLSNGITLHTYDGGAQPVNQLTLVWDGGRIEAPAPVVSRLAATLPREGAGGRTGAEIAEILDFHGALLRPLTDPHHTMINLVSLNSMTSDVLPVLRDMITCPTFPEEAYSNCLDIERQEYMIMMSKVMNVASRNLAPLIKGAANPDARGETLEDIESVTPDMVREYHDRVITADGAHAFLCGRLTPEIVSDVTAMLESLPAPHRSMPLVLEPYHPQAPTRVDATLPGAVQTAVAIGLPAPMRSHPDYVPLRFTVMALGGYFGSRLMKNIREDKGYTYGIGAYLMGGQEGSFINMMAQTDARYTELLLEEVGKEMKKLATAPPQGEEMERLRQYITSTLIETLDSPFAIMDYYKTKKCVALPDDYFERQVQIARRLTPEMISEMAARYLDPSQMRVSVVS